MVLDQGLRADKCYLVLVKRKEKEKEKDKRELQKPELLLSA